MGHTGSKRGRLSFSGSAPHVRGYIFIAAAALCWAVSACLGRAVFTGRLFRGAVAPVDPLILAQSRTTMSLIVLVPLMLARSGTAVFRMSAADRWRCIALGIFGIAGSNYFYYLAIQRTNVATAIVLQYTSPILVLLYMTIRGLQSPSLRRVTAVALAVAGAALAIGIVGAVPVRMDGPGVAAGLTAAVAFAYYNIGGGHLLDRNSRWSVLLWALAGAAIFWQFINPPWKIAGAHYAPQQWAFLGAFAVASVLLPFCLYFSGLQLLDPTRAIVGSCLEPVLSILIAASALQEALGPLQGIGIVLVLAAIVLAQPQGTRATAVERSETPPVYTCELVGHERQE